MRSITRTFCLVALLVLATAAGAGDEPEAVYAKMHEAALAQDLDQMRLYATRTRQGDLALPTVPTTYRITGKARRRDGKAVELRASGTADSVGLGYTQMFGVIDLVREDGQWKVERLSWSTARPGDYPQGYVIVQGQAPAPAPDAASAPRFVLPPSAPEPSHLAVKAPSETKPEQPLVERSAPPCVVKPVMTDDDLRACGATVAE